MPVAPARRWRRCIQAENLAGAAILAAMVCLPLAEIFLRAVFHSGIEGASALVQHLTLVLGMVGGAIAAREGRLLALSTPTSFLRGRWKIGAAIFAAVVSASVAFFLAAASWNYVLAVKGLRKLLAYGIPVWVIQLILPAGFLVIAVRLLWHASERWTHRLMALFLSAGVLAFFVFPPVAPGRLLVPALIVLLAATVAGAPIFVTLGGAALILFWGHEEPIGSIPLKHYSLVTNPTLPSLPLFILVGYLLAEGGASKRLVRLFQSLVGPIPGGPAIVTALVCAFFTSFTGASGVTILALGALLMPVLRAAHFSERDSLGLLTGAGSLGLLFPPCLPLILYAIIAQVAISHSDVAAGLEHVPEVTVEKMFLAGIGPGVLLVVLTACWGVSRGRAARASTPATPGVPLRQALWEAKWELFLPMIPLVIIFAGLATPVEAAAATALYAFVLEVVVYRDLRIFRDIPRVFAECALLIGGVLLILGVAMGLTNFLVDAHVPDRAVEWVSARIHAQWLFLLLLNAFLLVVGCLMDIYSATIVVVPLIVPMGLIFGVDPVHLGIVFLANMELGFLMPPVGMNLLLASYRFNKPIPEVIRAVLPMLAILLIGVLIITYVPALTLTLPRLWKE